MSLYSDAIDDFSICIEIKADKDALCNLGECFFSSYENTEAKKCYEQVLENNSTYPIALCGLCAVYFREEDYETAFDYAEKAASQDSCPDICLEYCALCSYMIKNGRENEFLLRLDTTNPTRAKELRKKITNK